MGGLIVLAVLFLLFWFALVRPQRKRVREQQELTESLEIGDEIVTAGGLYGVIREIEGEVLHVEIAPGLVVRTARDAVAGIVDEGEEEEPEEAAEDEAETVPESALEAGEPADRGYSERPS